jgi:hypothetical protein
MAAYPYGGMFPAMPFGTQMMPIRMIGMAPMGAPMNPLPFAPASVMAQLSQINRAPAPPSAPAPPPPPARAPWLGAVGEFCTECVYRGETASGLHHLASHDAGCSRRGDRFPLRAVRGDRADRLAQGTILNVYHHTDDVGANGIVADASMRPGVVGIAGSGMYFALSPENTHGKAQAAGGSMVHARVRLGNPRYLDHHREGDLNVSLSILNRDGCDSVVIWRRGGTEVVIYAHDQIELVSVTHGNGRVTQFDHPRPHRQDDTIPWDTSGMSAPVPLNPFLGGGRSHVLNAPSSQQKPRRNARAPFSSTHNSHSRASSAPSSRQPDYEDDDMIANDPSDFIALLSTTLAEVGPTRMPAMLHSLMSEQPPRRNAHPPFGGNHNSQSSAPSAPYTQQPDYEDDDMIPWGRSDSSAPAPFTGGLRAYMRYTDAHSDNSCGPFSNSEWRH